MRYCQGHHLFHQAKEGFFIFLFIFIGIIHYII